MILFFYMKMYVLVFKITLVDKIIIVVTQSLRHRYCIFEMIYSDQIINKRVQYRWKFFQYCLASQVEALKCQLSNFANSSSDYFEDAKFIFNVFGHIIIFTVTFYFFGGFTTLNFS